jgi:ligand-binding sensor domain-containing protein/signal transduction histidine kinase/DNA-binding response OmpR family regulator
VSIEAQINRYYTAREGLSNSFIHHIYQDATGLMWISTDDGLNCFDGEEFKVFYRIPSDSTSLICNKIIQVFEDSQGTLWIATLEGVMWFLRETESFETAVPQFNGYKVSCLTEDKNGNIWMSVHGKSVFCVDLKGNIIKQLNTESHDLSYVRDIYIDHSDNIWMGVREKGVFVYNVEDDNIECYNQRNSGLDGKWINSITCDGSGKMLVVTETGINIFDDKSRKFSLLTLSNRASLDNAYALICSKDNSLWVATDGFGLKKVDLKTNKLIQITGKLDNFITPHSKIHAIFEDKQGSIWLGVYQKGLYQISTIGKEINYYSINSFFFGKGDNEHCVLSILEDSYGHLWIGTDGGGLSRIDKRTGLSVPIRQFRHKSITSLYEDKQSNLWVGTYLDGIWKYNPDKNLFEKQQLKRINSQSSNREYVTCFTEDQSGRLWVGTGNNGIIIINPQTSGYDYMSVNDAFGGVLLPNNFVNAIEAINGDVWIGTYKGLLKYSINGASVLYTTENSPLVNDIIFSLRKDSRGGLWVGSLRGLNYIDSKGVISPNMRERDLPSSSINGIEEDHDKNIWISTISSIIKYNPFTNEITDFKNYEPLLQSEYWWGAHYKSASGELYFGGTKGVVSFYPPLSKQTGNPMNLIFTSLSFIEKDDTSEHVGEYKVKYKNIRYNSEVTISPHIRTFTFSFKAVTFLNHAFVNYKARLIGIDNKWQEIPNNNRQITFSNLNPGKYTLEIAAQTDGNEPLFNKIDIIVVPPWWRTTAAHIVYFLTGIGLICLGFILIRRRINIQKIKQQQKNIRKLMEYKLDFFAEISHEVRTPLTLVISPLMKLIREEKENSKVKTFQLMMRNINRVVSLVNEMIDIRKIDSDQFTLCVEFMDVSAFTMDIIDYFHDVADLKGIDIEFSSSGEHFQHVWVDRACFEKILFNLLSNAIKFSQENSVIHVHLNYDVRNLLITVQNKGLFITDSLKERIFERFVSREPNGKISSGLGLYLTRKFVEMHKGNITVDTNEDTITFHISIPYGRDHFSDKELIRKYSANNLGDSFILWNGITFNNKVTRHRLRTSSKVLVVDDEIEIRKYISQSLSSSYKILEAEDGEAGMKIAKEQIPDIIISDVIMPNMDGITLCKSLKNQESTAHIPIILLTVKATPKDQIETMQQSGADLFISKPFDIDYLFVCVRNMLNNRSNVQKVSRAVRGGAVIPDKKLLSVDEKFIEKFKFIVERELANTELSVETLSQELCVSRVHLHRKIKTGLGVSPSEYINTCRLHRAESILASNNLTISEVAYLVGFNSIGNFSVAFKKMFGVPPSYYREIRTNKKDT